MARPQVWRPEFQQLDNEYMKKSRAKSGIRRRPAVRIQFGLHVGVTGRQHGGKPRGFFLAAFAFAGFFEMTMVADFLQGSFLRSIFFFSRRSGPCPLVLPFLSS